MKLRGLIIGLGAASSVYRFTQHDWIWFFIICGITGYLIFED